MNIVELSEKNLFEAVSLFRVAKGSFYEALGQDPSDVDVRKMLLEDDSKKLVPANNNWGCICIKIRCSAFFN